MIILARIGVHKARMTVIQDALREAATRFTTSDSANLDAQVLLAAVLDVNRAYVLAYGERELTPEQQAQYQAWIARRVQGEPIAYILGKQAFYDREFIVSPAVLIPRPETELLLEQALTFTQDKSGLTVVDVGTGSGALAVTLAAHRPDTVVYATDISPAALAIAQQNARANDVPVKFIEGDLLLPLIAARIKVDVVMANLPYIATADLTELEVSKHEPHLALDGGTDGLDLIQHLLAQLPQVANEGALTLLEIGAEQGLSAQRLIQDVPGARDITILKDYAGHDRIARFIFHDNAKMER